MAFRQINRLGWKRDIPDPRDRRLTISHKVPLPVSFDLRTTGFMPPVYDQGNLGSCTANAIAAAVDFERKKQGEEFITPSRLFIYYNERDMEGDVADDGGAQIRDGIKVINQKGVCPEELWPYDESKFAVEPPPGDYTIALNNKCLQYSRVTQVAYYLQHSIAILKCPVVFGFTVFEDFMSDLVAETGIVPMPQPHESPAGGHAVLAVGYDANKQLVLVRNSWGESWGQQGYFWMPYKYVLDPGLADDLWVVQLEQ